MERTFIWQNEFQVCWRWHEPLAFGGAVSLLAEHANSSKTNSLGKDLPLWGQGLGSLRNPNHTKLIVLVRRYCDQAGTWSDSMLVTRIISREYRAPCHEQKCVRGVSNDAFSLLPVSSKFGSVHGGEETLVSHQNQVFWGDQRVSWVDSML